MSGECLCGAFAHKGEMDELEKLYPEVAEKIHRLEAKVRLSGNSRCVWGDRAASIKRTPQQEEDYPLFMPMCVGCNESKRRE